MTARDDDSAKPGYRRPPKSGQFRKGQSGNPKGRPRAEAKRPGPVPAHHSMRDLVRHEAARKIIANDASGKHELPTRQAVIRAQAHSALKGSVFA